MRKYDLRRLESKRITPIIQLASESEVKQPDFRPGYTLPQLIDQFFELGVTPDFPAADLGTDDSSTDIDENGDPVVDPVGNIRFGRDLRRQLAMDSRIQSSPMMDIETSPLATPIE